MKIQEIEKETQHGTEGEANIKIVRQVFEAFNTGDISKVNEFISEQYLNHESRDAVYWKTRGVSSAHRRTT